VQELERQVVAPVQILEDEHERLPVGDAHEEPRERLERAALLRFGIEQRRGREAGNREGELRDELDDLGGQRPHEVFDLRSGP
jgi:hypothetical protein